MAVTPGVALREECRCDEWEKAGECERQKGTKKGVEGKSGSGDLITMIMTIIHSSNDDNNMILMIMNFKSHNDYGNCDNNQSHEYDDHDNDNLVIKVMILLENYHDDLKIMLQPMSVIVIELIMIMKMIMRL